MRWHLVIFSGLFILFSSCQNEQKIENAVQKLYANENVFFELDLEEGKVNLEKFSQYFFTNFPHNDPTHGNVIYDQKRWLKNDLLDMKESEGLYAYTRAREDSLGFDSYRLTTKSFYNLNDTTNKILFVFKGSLPSANGVWPAWWLNGSGEKNWTYKDSLPSFNDRSLDKYSGVGEFHNTPSAVNNTDWPAFGEIDIIENINGVKEVHNTLHTCPEMCDSEWNEDGIIINCANARPGDVNKGCSGKTYEIDSLAGTFACIWEAKEIRFYYWPPGYDSRNEGEALSQNPKPNSWNKFLKNKVRLLETNEKCKHYHQEWQCRICESSTSCQFTNLKMIFNVTLCGLWAGNEFDDTENTMENCRDYILGEGKKEIDGSFMKMEYVSVVAL